MTKMTGNLEADLEGDFWADHYELYHGYPVDCLRDDYPEGFRYDCCDATTNEEGCEIGPHVAQFDHVAEMLSYLNRHNAPEARKGVAIIDLTDESTSSRHSDTAADEAMGSKRQRSPVCTRCKQIFEVSQKTERRCRHHGGTSCPIESNLTYHVDVCRLLTL